MRVESSKVGIKRLQSVIFCLVCPGYLHITRGLITAEQTAEMPHGAGDKDELKKKKKKKSGGCQQAKLRHVLELRNIEIET